MARTATPTLPGEWAERGSCRGDATRLFFVIDTTYQRDQPGKYAQARETCSRCPVREPCLEHAIVNDECCGMWGGLLPFERRKLRRKGKIVFKPNGERGFTIHAGG